MTKKQTRIFQDLEKDVVAFETEDVEQGRHADHEGRTPTGERILSALEKVQNARKRTQRRDEAFQELLEDVNVCLDSVRDHLKNSLLPPVSPSCS